MNQPAIRAEPVVDLPDGRVRGLGLPGLDVFRGLPYAAAPFGAHRFDPPAPVVRWTGVRDAGAFAPAPPQWPRQPADAAVAMVKMVGGEDCLALNVWTPSAREPDARLPVLVWIPGGGFLRGGSQEPLYDGAALARQGVDGEALGQGFGGDRAIEGADGIGLALDVRDFSGGFGIGG